MADPAFIYAFDVLGQEKFVELCGLLLASRYRGFLLSGVGSDGGIDAENDEMFGFWFPPNREAIVLENPQPNGDSEQPLESLLVAPQQKIIFQFKHKTVGRIGQSNARNSLLRNFEGENSELKKPLVISENPDAYVLVTNLEINSRFRHKFIEKCKQEHPVIERYQIVGLDDLVTWVKMEPKLRHLWFPTIFGLPQFNLQVRIMEGAVGILYNGKLSGNEDVKGTLDIQIGNIGTSTSYLSSISFGHIIEDGYRNTFLFDLHRNQIVNTMRPQFGSLEAGRSITYKYFFDELRVKLGEGSELVEVFVWDQIGNRLSLPRFSGEKIRGRYTESRREEQWQEHEESTVKNSSVKWYN